MVKANEGTVPLAVPDSFSFPYDLPYEIQTILMRVRRGLLVSISIPMQ